MSRIEAVDIQRGICFGVTETLCIRQNIGEAQFFPFHTGEDVVAGTIQDTVDAFDAVAHKRFTQTLDDGDTAAHTGFKPEIGTVLFRSLKQFRSELGDQRLVGSDHAFAAVQCVKDEFSGNGGTADEFHHNITAFQQFFHIRGEDAVRHLNTAVCCNIQVCNFMQLGTHTGAVCDNAFIFQETGCHSGTDGPESNNTDFQFFHDLLLKVGYFYLSVEHCVIYYTFSRFENRFWRFTSLFYKNIDHFTGFLPFSGHIIPETYNHRKKS